MAGVSSPDVTAERIAEAAAALPRRAARNLIAIAGPPGAGKSTIAALTQQLLVDRGVPTALVPMDGFHLDNALLKEREMLHRKGAPETFDLAGFKHLVSRLLVEDEVVAPEFDRQADRAIAGRIVVSAKQRTVILEGNYLLLSEPGWADLQHHWNLPVFLNVPIDVLTARLHQRWLDLGLDRQSAEARVSANDGPNARRVMDGVAEKRLSLS